MSPPTVDSIREGVLRRMERQANTIRLLIVGAAGVEALLLALALRIADLKNPTHVLILVTSVLGYTIVVLGLVALGAHVSRACNRVVAALRVSRRTRARQTVALDDLPELATETDDDPSFDAELIDALPALVSELPPACGIVVRLRYLEDLTLAEVAEALDVPVGTVKSRAAYGVALLRRRLAR